MRNFFKKNKGITLIALVVTIIVLLILAGITINMLFGENGIINQARMSAFATEMQEIKEKVDLRKASLQMLEYKGQTEELFNQRVTTSDELPDTLKQEIMYFRDGTSSEKEPSEYAVSDFESYINIINDNEIDGLWKIDSSKPETSDVKDNTYIYDERTDIVFKIKQTKIAGKVYHSYNAISLGKGGESSGDTVPTDTIIKTEFNNYSLGYYEPDLQGYDANNTYMVYYSSDFSNMYQMPIKDYISLGRPPTISYDSASQQISDRGETYTAFDYNGTTWANIVTKANGVESWWVWIPRYAYYTTGEQGNMSAAYITLENKVIRKENDIVKEYTLEEFNTTENKTYVAHPGFTIEDGSGENKTVVELKGIWMSKFNPTYTASGESTSQSSKICYEPDITGFDTENTYMVYYSEDFSQKYEMPLSEYTAKSKPRTTQIDGATYTLYDYNKRIWANIVTKANGVEAWWVWIPRYAYSTIIPEGEFSIIFVDLNNKPIDTETYGSNLLDTYIVHPGFTIEDGSGDEKVTTELKGIWMSKFNPTYDSSTSNSSTDFTLSN